MTKINKLIFLLLPGLFLIPQAQAEWVDISPSVEITQSSQAFDRVNKVLFSYVTVTNNSAEAIVDPVRLVITNPSIPVLNADGATGAGNAYLQVAGNLAAGASAKLRVDFELARVKLTFGSVLEIDKQEVPPISQLGVAQLGYLTDASVELYHITENQETLIYTTVTNASGQFDLNVENLNSDDWYHYKVIGGYDADVNDDGVLDAVPTLNYGTISLVAKGKWIKNSNQIVRVTAISDMVSRVIWGHDNSLIQNDNIIEEQIQKITRSLLSDVNEDEVIDYQDVLVFNPVLDQNKTKVSYNTIQSTYVNTLRTTTEEGAINTLARFLVGLTKPDIVIDGGLLQQIPFNVMPKLNVPVPGTVTWYLDNQEINTTEITQSGYYQLSAKVTNSVDQEVISFIKTTLVAIDAQEIGSVFVDPSENKSHEIYIYESEGISTPLAGTTVTIPAGAVSQSVTIKASIIDSSFIPGVKSDSIGGILRLEPSGLTFNKPVIVSMPYNQSLDDTEINTIRIARYSSDGSIDYLYPEYIDREKHKIIFATEHFSDFILTKGFFSLSESEIELSEIKETFSQISDLTDDEWVEVLNYRVSSEAPSIYELYSTWGIQQEINEEIKSSYIDSYNDFYSDEEKLGNVFSTFDTALKVHSLYGDVKNGAQIGTLLLTKQWVTSISKVAGFAGGKVIPLGFANWYIGKLIAAGAKAIEGYDEIIKNKQIKTYFSLRNNGHTAKSITDALSNGDDIEGTYPTAQGKFQFNIGGGATIEKLTYEFWTSVEFLYVQFKAYDSNTQTELLGLIQEVKEQIKARSNPYTKISSLEILYPTVEYYPARRYSNVCENDEKGVTIRITLKPFGYDIVETPKLRILDENRDVLFITDNCKFEDGVWTCLYKHNNLVRKLYGNNFTVEKIDKIGIDTHPVGYEIKVARKTHYKVNSIILEPAYTRAKDFVYFKPVVTFDNGYIEFDASYHDVNGVSLTRTVNNYLRIPVTSYKNAEFDNILVKVTPLDEREANQCKTGDFEERLVPLYRNYLSELKILKIDGQDPSSDFYKNYTSKQGTSVLFTIDLPLEAIITEYDIDGNDAFGLTQPVGTAINYGVYEFLHTFNKVGKFRPGIKYLLNNKSYTSLYSGLTIIETATIEPIDLAPIVELPSDEIIAQSTDTLISPMVVSDPDGDITTLVFLWSVKTTTGEVVFTSAEKVLNWRTPQLAIDTSSDFTVTLQVTDEQGLSAVDSMVITVEGETSPPIVFADENLKSCIQETLGLSQEEEPTVQELQGIDTLLCPDKSITDISDLSYLTSLQTLDLSNNQISDISVLDGLSELIEVQLEENPVLDCSAVEHLSNTGCVVQSPSYVTSKLNDTGITFGGNYPEGNNADCSGINISAQDCSHGRDVTHNDDSDGHAGFSFVKLDANGNGLPASATDWSCVRDHVTGLIWEKKTNDGGIHDKDNIYRWGGVTALGRDHASKEGVYYDDWNTLVDDSNNNNFCGFNDWRVPIRMELVSLIDYSRFNMAVDMDYFPGTFTNAWSSSPSAAVNTESWFVRFHQGTTYTRSRSFEMQVRLVRSVK